MILQLEETTRLEIYMLWASNKLIKAIYAVIVFYCLLIKKPLK